MTTCRCLGDSNTYGFDPRSYLGDRYDAQHRWPELLGQKLGWAVVNEGLNGRTIPASYEPEACDLLIVLLGTNDLLLGASPKTVCRRMQNLLQQLTMPVVLLAPPPIAIPEFSEAAREAASGYEALACGRRDVFFCNLQRWNLPLAFDGVHLTEKGHELLAFYLSLILQAF